MRGPKPAGGRGRQGRGHVRLQRACFLGRGRRLLRRHLPQSHLRYLLFSRHCWHNCSLTTAAAPPFALFRSVWRGLLCVVIGLFCIMTGLFCIVTGLFWLPSSDCLARSSTSRVAHTSRRSLDSKFLSSSDSTCARPSFPPVPSREATSVHSLPPSGRECPTYFEEVPFCPLPD